MTTLVGALGAVEKGSGTTSVNLTLPAGAAAGDVALAAGGCNSATPFGTQTGWTTLSDHQSTGDTLTPSAWIGLRTIDATDVSNGFVTLGSVPSAVGSMGGALFNGMSTTQDFTAVYLDKTSTSTANFAFSTQTTTQTGVTLFYLASQASAATAAMTPPSSPAAFTEDADRVSGRNVSMGHLIWSGSGATGTITVVAGATTRGVGLLVGLQPSSTGATGTVAATEGADTSAASAVEVFTGTSAATEAADTPAATALEVFSGSAAVTNSADTAAASGLEVFVGTSATTNAADVSSAAGLEVFSGSSATTNAPDAAAASGAEVMAGALAATEVGDVASASGTATIILAGTVAVVENGDTASASAEVRLWYFRPPLVDRRFSEDRPLYSRYTLPRGVSVVLVDGHYRRYPLPPSEILTALREGIDYFVGGHAAVQITGDVADALEADGFTPLLDNPDA